MPDYAKAVPIPVFVFFPGSTSENGKCDAERA
jgi:hypothetical protein